MRQIREASDDDLVRFAGAPSFVPAIEATRRLREAIRTEEHAIRRLTRWLVAFTIALVLLTAALAYVAVVEYGRR